MWQPRHLCSGRPVRAIEPTGKIVTAECFQCLIARSSITTMRDARRSRAPPSYVAA
jgi:hypothetical protein